MTIKANISTLNDACEFIVDCLHATAPIQEEGYPLIRTPNIGKGRLILDDVYRVSEDIYQKWTRRAIPIANDLILAREAPAGNVAIIKADQIVCLGQRTVHLRPNSSLIDPQFLCYFLLAPKQQALLLSGETGATAKHVNMKDIRKLPLEQLPDLPVQKRAGDFIAAYDDLIENNRRRIALLEKAARLLYEEWFVRFRFPGHERVKFVDGLPEGWFYQNPNEFISNHIGGGWGSDFSNGKNIQAAFVIRGTDIPSVEQGDIASVQMRYHGIKQLEARKLLPYDIIFEVSGGSTTQPVARTLILTPERLKMFEGDVICASFCKRFSMRSPEDAVFFYYHIRDSRDRGGILVYQKESASALKNFNFESFMSQYKIPIPPEPIRKRFFEFSGSILKQQVALSSEISVLVAARNLLLPRLMSGEVEV